MPLVWLIHVTKVTLLILLQEGFGPFPYESS